MGPWLEHGNTWECGAMHWDSRSTDQTCAAHWLDYQVFAATNSFGLSKHHPVTWENQHMYLKGYMLDSEGPLCSTLLPASATMFPIPSMASLSEPLHDMTIHEAWLHGRPTKPSGLTCLSKIQMRTLFFLCTALSWKFTACEPTNPACMRLTTACSWKWHFKKCIAFHCLHMHGNIFLWPPLSLLNFLLGRLITLTLALLLVLHEQSLVGI